MILPTNAPARKLIPMATGCLDYFPLALAAVAHLSYVGNQQHNPGKPLHWDRNKSTDHADCLIRHLIERGTVDTDGVRHSAKLAWRALALLQVELEKAQHEEKTSNASEGCGEGDDPVSPPVSRPRRWCMGPVPTEQILGDPSGQGGIRGGP